LVPTYEEDGFVLWESNVILRYLAGRYASGEKAALWPAEPHARAHADQWMEWQQTALLRPASVLFLGLARTPPEQRDAAAIAGAVADAGRLWGILDGRLAGREFVCGEALTLADIALGPHVHRWFSYPIARPELRHLADWYRRLCARAAYRARVAEIAVG
ncbi:MAG: glutathione S-transferase C-terminal domain-containing protein, partial [Acetobacteraceae bacterium]